MIDGDVIAGAGLTDAMSGRPRYPRGSGPAALPSARGGLLARQFEEMEQLQGRAQYAQQLSRDIEEFNLMNTTINMQRDALDTHHIPLRRSLESLQAMVFESSLQTASDLRRLTRMRQGVANEAARLGTLQHTVSDLRRQVRAARDRDEQRDLRAATEDSLATPRLSPRDAAAEAATSRQAESAVSRLREAQRRSMFGQLLRQQSGADGGVASAGVSLSGSAASLTRPMATAAFTPTREGSGETVPNSSGRNSEEQERWALRRMAPRLAELPAPLPAALRTEPVRSDAGQLHRGHGLANGSDAGPNPSPPPPQRPEQKSLPPATPPERPTFVVRRRHQQPYSIFGSRGQRGGAPQQQVQPEAKEQLQQQQQQQQQQEQHQQEQQQREQQRRQRHRAPMAAAHRP